jgi:hypothetical protein
MRLSVFYIFFICGIIIAQAGQDGAVQSLKRTRKVAFRKPGNLCHHGLPLSMVQRKLKVRATEPDLEHLSQITGIRYISFGGCIATNGKSISILLVLFVPCKRGPPPALPALHTA